MAAQPINQVNLKTNQVNKSCLCCGAWVRAAWVLDLVLRTVCSSCSSFSLSVALACRTDASTADCACTPPTCTPHHPLHAVLVRSTHWAPQSAAVPSKTEGRHLCRYLPDRSSLCCFEIVNSQHRPWIAPLEINYSIIVFMVFLTALTNTTIIKSSYILQ
jgi:hypothetical protein